MSRRAGSTVPISSRAVQRAVERCRAWEARDRRVSAAIEVAHMLSPAHLGRELSDNERLAWVTALDKAHDAWARG